MCRQKSRGAGAESLNLWLMNESPAPETSSFSRPPARLANGAFLCAHWAHFLALGMGSGLSPLAPGTVGTLWAWLTFGVLQSWLTPVQLGVVMGATLLLSVWATQITAKHLRQLDPGCIVIDEIIAFWLILWLITPTTWGAQFGAFVLFRLLDAIKPGPVGWADQAFKGPGWWGAVGVVLDDLVAALCVLLVFALWRF